MRASLKFVWRLSMLFLPSLWLLFGCGAPIQESPVLPDAAIGARTPIALTREAKATADATGKRAGGFQAGAGFATRESPATPDAAGGATREADPTATVDAITQAQLTKAPTIEAFLTKVATTTSAEETPAPSSPLPSSPSPTSPSPTSPSPSSPEGCAGGCVTYPTWCEPPIKGTVDEDGGRRIYYMPGDEAYDETQIEPDKGEYYFCTPEEAEAAGFSAHN